MAEKTSQRMSTEAITFIDNINTNMIRSGIIERAIPRTEVWDKIVKYFRLNNDRYIELVKMENKK